MRRKTCRLLVWRSSLSVPQLLDSPSPLLTNTGKMLWDKLCWLLALLALTSGLPVSNEPLSAPRIFLSFKGKTLKLLLCVCVWPRLFSSVFSVITGVVAVTSLLSCSISGMGKLLALAEFRAWQDCLTESLIVCRCERGVMTRARRCAADCPDYSGQENMSSFNRTAAISSPNRPLCDLGSLLKSSQI